MGKKRIAPIEDTRDGVLLVFFQLHFRGHAWKYEFRSVIAALDKVIEVTVIVSDQAVFALFILKDPLCELAADCIHLLVCQHGFFQKRC